MEQNRQVQNVLSIINKFKQVWTSGSNTQRRPSTYSITQIKFWSTSWCHQKIEKGGGGEDISSQNVLTGEKWNVIFPIGAWHGTDIQLWPPHCKIAIDRQETITNDKKVQKHRWRKKIDEIVFIFHTKGRAGHDRSFVVSKWWLWKTLALILFLWPLEGRTKGNQLTSFADSKNIWVWY